MMIKYYFLKPMKSACMLLIGASIAFSVTSCKDDDDDNDNTPAVSDVDRDFAMKASYSNNAEIALGNLTKNKNANPLIKNFGNTMVIHHTKANTDFAPIAAKKNITLPGDLDPEHKLIQGQLNLLDGTKFDSVYINGQVKDHQTTKALFENEIAKGSDTEIKDFARKTLPVITAHLTSADSIKKVLKY